jgi:hypothetical protein
MAQTLQDKQEEKGRLAKHYRALRRSDWEAFCQQEPRIIQFGKDVRARKTSADVLAYVRGSWVVSAPQDARIYALRIVNAHADKMARAAGGEALNDPLPPKRNLFIAVRELLGVR